MKQYYKLAHPDGWDFQTGKTINYRENVGKWVKCPDQAEKQEYMLCSPDVIHASTKILDCFVGAKIPCSAYKVKGTPIVEDEQKAGFKKLFVIKEFPHEDFNELFGFNILEAENPVNPLKLVPPEINEEHLKLLKEWYYVWASVRDSVGDYVWASVRASVGDYVWASVWASVWDSVRASVGDSVWASVRAYIGSLFPNIKKWKNVKHKRGEYPFQSAVTLWKQGLVPSFDGSVWRLHGGKEMKVLWEGKI